MALLALLLFASCATALRAQTIQIELVNGKTGRPITDRSELSVWVGKWKVHSGQGRLVIPTDKHDGIALLTLTHNDSEINVPECAGDETADYQELANKQPKASKQEWAQFNKKWTRCDDFEVKNPIARYADSITVQTLPGDFSWKLAGPDAVGFVPCWVETSEWFPTADFSTEDILQHGVVTANTCGKATASPQPGHLVLFVRLLTEREYLRLIW
jgi:hypothetical protein